MPFVADSGLSLQAAACLQRQKCSGRVRSVLRHSRPLFAARALRAAHISSPKIFVGDRAVKTARGIVLFSIISLAAPRLLPAVEPLWTGMFQPRSAEISGMPNRETPDGTAIDDVASKSPSLWTRMKNGTANAWHKTTSVFNKKKTQPSAPLTGSRASVNSKPANVSSYDANKAKVDGSDVRTVGDFIKQPRLDAPLR